MSDVNIVVNGIPRIVKRSTITPQTTLNEYLRSTLDLTGTKYMCLKGGCGSCIVTARILNPRTNVKEAHAVSSCLVLLLSCEGWEIVTVEGLGNRWDGYDEAQRKIVQYNATQCGFCTPGMIMNMHSLQEAGKTTMAEIENSFGGNMCRCTGYRPILAAFKSMASDKDESLLGIIPDIEELKLCMESKCSKSCSKKGTSCSLTQGSRNLGELVIQDWYKVSQIAEIFEIITFRGTDSYRLVAGNTAKGVYEDMAEGEYYIDIRDVLELRDYTLNTSELSLGANLPISEAMDIFRDVSGRDDGFKYLTKLVEHLDLVATVTCRNMGTLAGNLTIKHVHNEFPSDIFLLLETIGARLILDNGYQTEVVTPMQYLYTDMKNKIIRRINLPPLDATYKLEFYKIMKRYQNDHAIVNAGFLMQFANERVVQSARIVFGGINPQFVHATSAEAYLPGKDLFTNGNMQSLFNYLFVELQPDLSPPNASPEYRKQLAIALTYKFILSIAPSYLVSANTKLGGQKLTRAPVSRGSQEYIPILIQYPVGASIPKLEAADQASGAAKFITDLPDKHNQAFAAFVLGKAPPGSVVNAIDASEALALPGVLGFYQASDIEGLGGINSFMAPNNIVAYHVDEPIFIPIGDSLKYYYQPVAMVVAETERLAEEAAEMVKVQYTYSTVTPLISVRDVLARKAVDRIHHEGTFLPSCPNYLVPLKLKGQVDTQFQYHYHLELQVANVVPDDDGGFSIFPSSQYLDGVQFAVARALNVPANTLNLSVKRLGSSHGAKITRGQLTACAAVLAALKLHRPVKFMIPLETNMEIMGKRTAVSSNYEVGFYQNGCIGYLNNEIYTNLGAYGNALLDITLMNMYMCTYISKGFETDTYSVRTDVPASTYMRAPGSVEGNAIIQSIIDHIAYKLNMDPIDVRLANLNGLKHPVLLRMITECLLWSNYRARRAEIEQFNKVNRWRKRGISMIPMVFELIFLMPHYVQVSVYQADGTISITHGGVEVGQGINTKIAQVAAHLLLTDINNIKVKATNEFVSPNNISTGGSVTTEGIIIALEEACTQLLFRINDAATQAQIPTDAPWITKVRNAVTSTTPLTENQMFFPNPPNSKNYAIYGVAVSEVEVDILTGNYIVQRVDLMEDTGDSMNPGIDIGQCEGAFVMGMGHWTMEDIIFDHNGALLTNNTWTYKIPGARDIPVDFRVKFPAANPNPMSLYRNKATSEAPICLAFSVPLAIRHAIKSARLQANPNADPWSPLNGPTSTEWTFLNSLNDFRQYTL